MKKGIPVSHFSVIVKKCKAWAGSELKEYKATPKAFGGVWFSSVLLLGVGCVGVFLLLFLNLTMLFV